MKSTTTLTALALTLLMFLLVLLAAFVFTFQRQISFRDELGRTEQGYEALQQEQAELELEHASLRATATIVSSLQATADVESIELRAELVEADRQVGTLAAQLEVGEQDLQASEATRSFYDASGPLVTIVEPQAGQAITGEEITLVFVASDVVGIRSVTISIDDQLFDVEVTPGQSVTVRQPWLPESTGPAIITVTAINNSNVTSQPAAMTVEVVNPPATSTPSPTPTATATPSPEPTGES